MTPLARSLFLAALLACVAGCAGPGAPARSETAPLPRAQAEAIVASPDRSEADRKNDVRRKPVDMLVFIAPRPGMVVVDVIAGGGYTSELLARAVAPAGRVYSQ